MMRTTGSVPPTVIADTDEGYVFYMPTDLADDAAKDRFAEVTRLFAMAQNARARPESMPLTPHHAQAAA